MTAKAPSAPRVAALVGPYLSGKTSLLEGLLHTAGALPRKGSVKEGSTVGDPSPEAKARQMSVELGVATTTYLGDPWTFIDTPGSVEFTQETFHALMVADVAVVVCEPDPNRAVTVGPVLRFLDDHKIPHVLFINKMDLPGVGGRLKETLTALQGVSDRPLVLREIPIRDGDVVSGYVDLVSERAYHYKPGQPSDIIQMPESVLPEEKEARQAMLEHLADTDDHLMEELLEDVVPPKEEVYQAMTKDLQQDLIVEVFFGSAEKDSGLRRLLKALRHEAPEAQTTEQRLGIEPKGDALVQIFKTLHAPHVGKLSIGRVWRGELTDGMTLAGQRLSGVYHLFGGKQEKLTKAIAGDIVALGRLEETRTGQALSPGGPVDLPWVPLVQPVVGLAIHATKSGDEVKLSTALQKLIEEDASYALEQNADTSERILWGQGEIHLKVALDRLKSKFNVEVAADKPQVPYKETIKKAAKEIHGRHKHQTGGHGQFGDVWIHIKPLARGEGIKFVDEIVGGVVPRQFIPAVEAGMRDFCKQGPLGFPVVDLEVTLYFGSYHTVDSNEMSFKAAARIAMNEGMPKANPVLLEPILKVQISVPSEYTSKAQRLITGRRGGQVLGFDAKPGWNGWDVVEGLIPQSEVHDVIIELRSLTMGVGTFTWAFDHLQELEGRDADKVVAARKEALAN
ncbi:MAG: elongation factor G [Acidobacteria bacterium]|nr:elongation factor G [Acidobacteriota bacterium]